MLLHFPIVNAVFLYLAIRKMHTTHPIFRNTPDAKPLNTTGENNEKFFKQIARVALTIHVIGNIQVNNFKTYWIPSIGHIRPET